MRKLCLLLAALGIVGTASAQVYQGTMTAAYGWVRQPDGTKKDVTGMKFKYTFRTVKAAAMDENGRPVNNFPRITRGIGTWADKFVPNLRKRRAPGGGNYGIQSAQTTIYHALNPSHPFGTSGYGYNDPLEWIDPSSMDDVNIAASGAGRPWNELSFGVHVSESTPQSLFRIRIFNTNVENPPGFMDFNQELADFGNFLTPPPPNNPGEGYVFDMAPAGVQQAGITIPDTDCYVAIQWREPTFPWGFGDFEVRLYNLYYVSAPPTVGSSAATYWFDWEPLDGIYENTELDTFESPNLGNLALHAGVDVNTQSATGLPYQVTTTFGTYLAGTFNSLWFSDGNSYSVREVFSGSRADPSAAIEVLGTVPTQSPLSFRVSSTATTQNQDSLQKIEIWRYGGGSPGWVLFDSRNTTAGTACIVDQLYGGTIPLSQFVGPNGDVKVRMSYFRNPAGSRALMTVFVNKLNWIVTY